METILCAAIWYNDNKERVHNPVNIKTGIVVCAYRHCNCFTILAAIYPSRDYILDGENSTQGFLTNTNRFVDRKEAWTIADNAKQILDYDRTNKNMLFSEDIY